MAGLALVVALTAVGVFVMGVVIGVVLVVAVASRCEDRRLSLRQGAPNRLTAAVRRLTGVGVRNTAADERPDGHPRRRRDMVGR